jgi:hypothetical protein
MMQTAKSRPDSLRDAINSYLPSVSATQVNIITRIAEMLPQQSRSRLSRLIVNSFNPGEPLTDARVEKAASEAIVFMMRQQWR